MIKIITVIIAVLLIGFIAWWFFGKREQKEVDATMNDNMQKVTVTVDGGYSPNTVVLKKDVPAEVIFDRKDPSNCLEKVVFEDFGINQFLPEKQKTAIKIDTSKAGEYNYACGMNMFHGKVIVK
ncbi:cupredoxin domain-containing protein [Lactobacillus sp. YT155]|uniref:cupredoxin domain-containing protein n=1 Tax=Lactobacillus sp. YT155 TaxID=3060955 RepID=UPI00265E27EE|nr:cupredoxin domain-containing protein [Lactobacillus sp. YT155]MDO1604500.1 cupredoxin domain-containing protein [Lactobacillus sp. YT155]